MYVIIILRFYIIMSPFYGATGALCFKLWLTHLWPGRGPSHIILSDLPEIRGLLGN